MIVSNTEIQFLLDGQEYHELYIGLIDSSQKRVVLHTYIFEFDEFGEKVFESLVRAANRGVFITFVVDGIGTGQPKGKYLKKMKESGIQFCEFNKIKWKSVHRWGRRLHHKALVVDGRKSIVGGINVITPFDPIYGEARLDFAFYLEGNISSNIEKYCMHIFKPKRKHKLDVEPFDFNGPRFVRFSINDWVYDRKSIASNYSEILGKAEKEIIIINSYFFPRKKFLKQLVAASNRGVTVKLVLPKFSDWNSHILASEYLYAYLLRNNIQVFQWNKSILHGKMALVDNKFTMLGSFNLHYTSFQGNLEMNVEVLSDELSLQITNKINTFVIDRCNQIQSNSFQRSNTLILRFRRFFYYSLISIVSNFLLGFIHQEEIDREEKYSRPFAIIRIVVSFLSFFLGLLGLVLPVIPGVFLIIFSLVIIYPIIIKNHKNL